MRKKRRRKKRRRSRKNVSYENKEQTMLGQIVDLPFGEFKKQIEEQKVNLGVTNNLILTLSSAYYDLRRRKEAVLDLVFSNKKTKEEVKPVLEGLYAEMTKLEQKIVYLKQRSKELLDLGNTTS